MKLPDFDFQLTTLISAIVFGFVNLAFGGTTPPHHEAQQKVASVESYLVRVNSTNQPPDFLRPWSKKNPYPRKGLGVIVGNNEILTTAETIANHTYVELELPGSGQKTAAIVTSIDYNANLALLQPENSSFLDGKKPAALDVSIRVGNRVDIIQLEQNGGIAETPATVTTITSAAYPLDDAGFLIFRLTAPIQQRDNSFVVPAFKSNRLVGLLMRYDVRNQTADAVPSPVIQRFLDQAHAGEHTGFPRTGLACSPLRDPQLRAYLHLENQQGGVYVSHIGLNSPAAAAGFQKGDVILKVNNYSIDADGNYDHPIYGKIPFSNIITLEAKPGETIPIEIVRPNPSNLDQAKTPPQILTLNVKPAPADRSQVVVPNYLYDEKPHYLIKGGLVFIELSRPYLQEWGPDWQQHAPQRLVHYDQFQQELPEGRKRIVLLSQVLPTPASVGYEHLNNNPVTRINNRPINSLDDLALAFDHPIEGIHRIELEDDPKLIFIDDKLSTAQEPLIRQHYGINPLQSRK